MIADELEATVVLAAACTEVLRSEPFVELFREKLVNGRLIVYVPDGPMLIYSACRTTRSR